MAVISLPGGLKITTKDAVDTRMVLTKTEMASMLKGAMPDNYICVCKDDGKFYIYNANNEKDPEFGRFVLFEDQIDMEGAKFKENLDRAVADNIEQGSESTKIAVKSVVNEVIEQVKIDGQIVE